MQKDYYKTLQVAKNATKDEIKKAFRTLAHKYHPDKQTGDEAKFKEISEAYSVLSDDKKRAEYDSYGRVFSGGGSAGGGQQGQGFGGFDFSGFQGGFGQGGFEGVDLGDIFGDIFGGGRGGIQRGRDISIDLEISFKEAVFGVERRVLLTKTSVCDSCSGTGAEKGSELETCKGCNGNGKVHESKSSVFGTFTSVRACGECHGTGKVPKEKCKTCKGARVARKEEEVVIRVPSGINNGEMIRLTGGGEAVAGGDTGDLYIKIHVHQDKNFHKEGSNLITSLSVKLTDALLGGEYTLQTLDGDAIVVKVPQGVSFGEIIRVKGRGVPSSLSSRGDLLIKILIDMPKKLSKKSKDAIGELKQEGI
ncbi:DnaJ domain-containing protein [Candidatus Kaiserbacteria bacterium]|nr:DnaJ domain-containing protein [Candidatus Kaiserbacteria bacterium]